MYLFFRSVTKQFFLGLLVVVALLFAPKTTLAAGEFITTWETTGPNEQVTIPTTGGGYNYDVDWGDSSSDTGVTGNGVHVYALAGTHTVTISGTFPRIYINNSGDKYKILSVEQWGTTVWTSMASAFYGANHLVINAVDAPDLSVATDMSLMFGGAEAMNQDISGWDVSHITNMSDLFFAATSFDQSLASWDVSHVTNMSEMFYNATAFNHSLNGWGGSTGSVTNMSNMFHNATAFNQPLDAWDVSSVTNMAGMFSFATAFNQSLNAWGADVSSVTDMSGMFQGASVFNQSLSSWVVTSVTNMSGMFTQTNSFNQPLGAWNVSSVTDMNNMFSSANAFNQSLNAWGSNLSHVTNMSGMFYHALSYNQPMNSWDVSAVTDMSYMFNSTPLNQALNSWSVANVTNMFAMFAGCASFNQSLNSWNVASVTNMANMFTNAASFNQPLNLWNVASVTNMSGMFQGATVFNQAIGGWNVSNVTNLSLMFSGTGAFNQNIDAWDVSKVTDLSNTFGDTTAYNQPLNSWNVSHVTNMNGTFIRAAAFNQPLNSWNVSSVGDMGYLFFSATLFDQPLDNWDVTNVAGFTDMFYGVTLSRTNYDAMLTAWAALSVQPGMSFNGGNSQYFTSAAARQSLIDDDGWAITDGGVVPNSEFITTWQTTAPGETITIPTTGGGYSYVVDWGDLTATTTHTGNATHVYASAGTHTVKIVGIFPRIYINNAGDKAKIYSVEQWGLMGWTSMSGAFYGASHLVVNASDAPNLSSVTDLSGMFEGASVFNQNINSWDTSHVTNMSLMFESAFAFNQPLSTWDVSHVTNMYGMFANAASFNQDITGWDVSSVTNMGALFQSANSFNQDIGAWNVSHVTNFLSLFFGNTIFNQDIGDWDVSSATDMRFMFQGATAFNQDIGAWDVSHVTNMQSMLSGASIFNQNISAWDVSSVTNMSNLFLDATSFNQPLNTWAGKVSNVGTMENMFSGATAFNQPLNLWNVSNVTTMATMFNGATSFNQNLGTWNVANVTDMTDMFNDVTLSTVNYNAMLIAWSGLAVQAGVPFDGGNSIYTTSTVQRASLISDHSWTITDGGVGVSHTLTYASGAGGTLTGSTSQTIFDGENGSAVTAVPASGYSFTAWSDASTANPRTDTSITTDHTFTATFTLIPVVVVSGGGGGGGGGGGAGSFSVQPSALAESVNGTTLRVLVNGSNEALSRATQRVLQLTFNADPAKVNGYAISLRPDFLQASIYPYVSAVSYTLPEVSGDYTLYTKFYSITGNPSETIVRTVSYVPVALPVDIPVTVAQPLSSTPQPVIVEAPLSVLGSTLVLVRADAKEFGIRTSSSSETLLGSFIDQGTNELTRKLGSGERRALIRDLLDTLRTSDLTIQDIERTAAGLIPLHRNVAQEKVQLQRVRTTFRTLFGHDPIFRNTQENLAWNTLMYRMRFPRSLPAEAKGIQSFKQLFKKEPKDPFQWATVRVMGYVR